MCDQTAEHLSHSGLYALLQSPYRAGHSRETALLKVQNNILLAMDRQHVTLLVLLDLSAAFDIVDHQVLLGHLWHYRNCSLMVSIIFDWQDPTSVHKPHLFL